jgi:hypothetical protein
MKKWYQSKTVWFNLLTGLLTSLGLAQGVVPPEAIPYIATLSGIVNVILRVWFTDTKIA